MPPTVNHLAPPPVLRVLAAALLVTCAAGCSSVAAMRVLPLVDSHGAHGVSVRRDDNDQFRYVVTSALPGRVRQLSCVPVAGESARFSVTDCTGRGGHDGVAEALEQSEASLRSLLGRQFAIHKVHITLVPEGVRYILVSRNVTPKLMLDYSMAFRTLGRGEEDVRSAVRRFVHELTHLALGAQAAVTLEDEEYLASVAESCVEFDVFGSARLAASDVAPNKGFNRRQLVSIRANYRAFHDLRKFMEGERETSPAKVGEDFPAFCREVLGSLAAAGRRAHQAPK